MKPEYSPAECVCRTLRTLNSMKLDKTTLAEQIKFILEYAIDFNVVLSYYSMSYLIVQPFKSMFPELVSNVFPPPTTDETLYHNLDRYIQEEYSPLTDVDESAKESLDKWDEYLRVEDFLEDISTEHQIELLLTGCLAYMQDIQKNNIPITIGVIDCLAKTLTKLIKHPFTHNKYISVLQKSIHYLHTIMCPPA